MSVKKVPCKRCQRTRWALTFLMLAAMSAVLYLDVMAK